LGEKAALANIDEIRKLSDPVKYAEIQKKREEFRKTWQNSYSFTKFAIVGNKKFDESYFKRFIPKNLTNLKTEDLKEMVNQIYQNGSFANIFYEVKGDTLVINVAEKPSNYLVTTGNINNEDLAAVSIGFQGYKLIGNSDIRYSINGIVNEEYGINGKAAVALGGNSKGLITTDLLIKKDIIRNQESGEGTYEFSNRIFRMGIGFGAEIKKNFVVGIGGGYQKSMVRDNVDSSKNVIVDFPYYNALGYYDSRDSAVFPTRGLYLRIDYLGASSNGADFNTINAKAEYNKQITKKITITPGLRYVTTNGNGIPETYYPKLGGYRSSDYSFEFRGIPSSKYRGKSLLIGDLKLQYNMTDFMFANLIFSNVNISQDSFSIGNEMKQSYSGGFGIKTPTGPIFLGVSTTRGEDITYFLNLGYDMYAE
jgi:NTE family protein